MLQKRRDGMCCYLFHSLFLAAAWDSAAVCELGGNFYTGQWLFEKHPVQLTTWERGRPPFPTAPPSSAPALSSLSSSHPPRLLGHSAHTPWCVVIYVRVIFKDDRLITRKNDFFEFPRDLRKSGQLLKVFKIALYGILKINYLEMVF